MPWILQTDTQGACGRVKQEKEQTAKRKELGCGQLIYTSVIYIHIYIYIYIYTLFQVLFHYRLLWDTEYSSLYWTVSPYCLSIRTCSGSQLKKSELRETEVKQAGEFLEDTSVLFRIISVWYHLKDSFVSLAASCVCVRVCVSVCVCLCVCVC